MKKRNISQVKTLSIFRLFGNAWSPINLYKWFPKEYEKPTSRINKGTIFDIYLESEDSDNLILISKDRKRVINMSLASLNRSIGTDFDIVK